MAEIMFALTAGVTIVKIICNTINDINQRNQRFKMTLKRKRKRPNGEEFEDEITFEFGSIEEMRREAAALLEITDAAFENHILLNKISND